jgi:3-oxoacyl-[acyl-carrier protein] reductase
MNFKNKTVFITGVNRGLGKLTFEKFLKEGSNIICTVRKRDIKFNNYLKKIKKKFNNKIRVLYFDFENRSQITNSLGKLKKNLIIDILINNAGFASGSILEMTKIDDIEKIFKINYFSQLLIIQKLLPFLKKSKNASIINVSSISAFLDHRGTIAYGSSKSALSFATKIMANEFLAYKIRVNAIAPSAIETDMFTKMDKRSKNKLLKDTNLKKPLKVNSVIKKILFLSSDKSINLNGKIIKKF